MVLLFYSAYDDARAWIAALHAADPTIEVRVWPEIGDPGEIDAALVWKPPTGALAALPRLRLIINLGAGVDHLLGDDSLPQQIPIVRIVDPEMSRMMTQYVLLAVLRHHRNLHHFEQARAERRWAYVEPRASHERRVGVMGLGALGGTAAEELVRQGFQVSGWSRTPRSLAGVRCFCGRDQLHEFLSGCDILVLLLPLTRETRGIIGREALAALPRGGCVINVGRGSLIDEQALIEALDAGWIAEATLDVFSTEPLPPHHPLWERPQVMITPHLASIALPRSGARQVADNLRRLASGEALLNQVEGTRGY
jgi:glyoxylate/hydroxypyruvate reductase A